MLHHLEISGVINWNTDVVWQARPVHARAPSSSPVGVVSQPPQEEWMNVQHLSLQLEECYHRGPKQAEFTSGFNTFQVDYEHKQMVNRHTGGMFEVRRLAFAPLMPLLVSDPLLQRHWARLHVHVVYLSCRLRKIASLCITLHLLGFGASMIEHLSLVKPSSLRFVTSRPSFSCMTGGASTLLKALLLQLL